MNKTLDVLLHTSRTGRYVTDDAEVIKMATEGLLCDYGPQKLAAGMHFFTLAAKGRELINEYYTKLPKPKPLTRSQKRYREYLGVSECYESFKHFLTYHNKKTET